MQDRLSHKLPEEENSRIFAELIKPLEYSDLVEQAEPVAIFVGGQPGAGKTALQEAIFANIDARDVAIINGDDFRVYHPEKNKLETEDDTLAAYYTDADVGEWIERSIEYVKQHKANVLVEGTLRNPNTTIDSACNFQKSGYTAELHVVIAQEFFSRLRIFFRYLDQRRDDGAGRYTLMQAHNASYKVLPQSLVQIAQSGVFKRIVIYTIEQEVVFDSMELNGETIQAMSDLVRYIRSGLHKSIEDLLADVHDARRQAIELHCNDMVLGDIDELNRDILAYVSKSA
jgi:AAA15 family ATPase/GTPase